jgi:homospermidine synthase
MCLDFAAAQGSLVAQTVETDEGANPVDISLFGSQALMQVAHMANTDRRQTSFKQGCKWLLSLLDS